MPRAARVPAVLAFAVAICAGWSDDDQSTLRPHSHAARDIATLWWILLIISAVVCAVVTLLVVIAALRRRAAPSQEDPPAAKRFVVVAGFVVPLAVLIALFVLTLNTLPATSAPRGKTDLTVRVTGRQWFWDVAYPKRGIKTANEIHIPARTSVRLQVRSRDVIHSFWAPELNRKIDMIPGHTNSILLRADRAGTYRGQCAEFCGLQHANMAFFVIAQPRAKFEAWARRESKPPQQPSTMLARRGLAAFLAAGCGGCHAIKGTSADQTVGPDLTHIASRRTLAAGTIPNAPGYLAGWIVDPQHVKPGNKMPGLDLSGPQLESIVAYLRTLR